MTAAIALAFVSAGSVGFVARIISMFFMVTYGALCAIRRRPGGHPPGRHDAADPPQVDFNKLVEQRLAMADLVICGFTDERLHEKGAAYFQRHAALRDVLWVQARQQLLIE